MRFALILAGSLLRAAPALSPAALASIALASIALAPAAWAQPAAPAAPASQPFRVLNRTGVEASQLYAVRSGRADWGRNLLPRPMPSGAAFSLRPNAEAGCRFDIRLVLADGREAVQRNTEICEGDRSVAIDAALAAAPAPPRGRPTPPSAQPNPGARAASGTGFLVADERVMTNQHVVNGCDRLLVRGPDGRSHAAVPPVQVDPRLDLALLRVPGLTGSVLAFRSNPVRRGEGVVAYGFPLAGLLSSDPKLTRGEINGLAGLGDDPNQFQISAPVQPGNSGGPLLDMQGNVVGVVVSKLNAQRVAQRTGDIAQNINFAVKGERAAAFLRAAGVPPATAESRGPDRSAADVGEVAGRSTVFIRCEQ
ncbi:trypsin-like peptidase domain-containing protein [Roseomonas sp. OT10]|uniref:trypsin-like peptidase domain-containing protein n=1 Tax=Roseomonas cutis TaxID=2897332 RepID=UPI001E351FC2|nr:trypsin-like peptidase domain-containing protein [Roseomonas sp. OT10]UFN47749.1 trypsin-like peptidase domain-containing protein [Roseomonas sp. OT10]